MAVRRLLAILLCMLALFPSGVFAYESYTADEYYALTGAAPLGSVKETFANKQQLSLSSPSAILVESSTGEILYEKAADERRPIASITKIMTLILVMEALESGKISLEDVVPISEHAYSMGGSQIWLEPGEIFTVDELLRAVAVASANDAAVALAEFVGGSEEAFVASMNERAQQLGMTNTEFKNSNGLDENGHLSCARDVAAMSREVLRHELVRNYITIWQDSLRGGETELTNTNKMLKSFSGITGIKTGTTGLAGVCISASAKRDDMEIIAVVLGCSDSKSRFESAKTLLEYGFANYEVAKLAIDPQLMAPIKVKLGEQEICEVECVIPSTAVVEKGKAAAVTLEVDIAQVLEAPVEAGQIVGETSVFCEGQLMCKSEIRAVCEVKKLEFGTAFGRLCAIAGAM